MSRSTLKTMSQDMFDQRLATYTRNPSKFGELLKLIFKSSFQRGERAAGHQSRRKNNLPRLSDVVDRTLLALSNFLQPCWSRNGDYPLNIISIPKVSSSLSSSSSSLLLLLLLLLLLRTKSDGSISLEHILFDALRNFQRDVFPLFFTILIYS